MNIKIPELQCLRCGYIWVPRQKDVKICPKCKSAYWNTPKKQAAEEKN